MKQKSMPCGQNTNFIGKPDHGIWVGKQLKDCVIDDFWIETTFKPTLIKNECQ